MAMTEFGLGFLLSAKDTASAVFHQLRGAMEEVVDENESLKASMISGAKSFGAGVVLAGGAAFALKKSFDLAGAAGTFDLAMARVGATSDATTEDLNTMREAALRLARESKFGPGELALAMERLAIEGVTPIQQADALRNSMNLARIAQLDLAQAVEVGSDTLQGAGMGMGDFGLMVDKITIAIRKLELGGADFRVVMAQAGTLTTEFGQSLDDTLIAVGMMRQRGVQAGRAAMQYGEILRRLAAEQGVQKAIQEAGVNIFDKQTGQMRSMVDIILDIQNATSGWTEQRRNQLLADISGGRGMRAMMAIMNASIDVEENGRVVTLRGAEAIAEYRRQMQQSTGAATAFLGRLSPEYQSKINRFTSAWEALRIELGGPFKRAFTPIADRLIGMLDRITNGWKSLTPATQDAIAKTVLWTATTVGAIGTALMFQGSMKLLGVAVKWLLPGISNLVPATRAFIGILPLVYVGLAPVLIIMGKVILVAAAVAAVSYVVYKAWEKNFGGLRDSVNAVAGQLSEVFLPVWVQIKSAGIAIWNVFLKIIGVLGLAGMQFANMNKDGVATILFLELVGRAASFAIKAFAWAITVAMGPVAGFITTISNLIQAWDRLTSLDFLGVAKAIGGALLGVSAGFLKSILVLFNVNTASVQDMVNVVMDSIAAVVYGAVSLLFQGITKVGKLLGFDMAEASSIAEEYRAKAITNIGEAASAELFPGEAKPMVIGGVAPGGTMGATPGGATEQLLKSAGRPKVSPIETALSAASPATMGGGSTADALRRAITEAMPAAVEQGIKMAQIVVNLDGRVVNDVLRGAGQRESDAALGQ
jgi:TP901 family phage tail tape measure protein